MVPPTTRPAHGPVRIGVIGGSGLYHLPQFELVEETRPETPWGLPSAAIRICRRRDSQQLIAFLSRHGVGHARNPSEIAALKSLGVELIVAFSAVGSLREEIRPLDFIIPDQVIDRTKGIRAATFFENGCVGHVEFGDPFTTELADLIYAQRNCLEGVCDDGTAIRMHRDKTLVVMEGPAFSTRAESKLYRSWGCDIINMSTLPEAKLAREAEISYQVICMATDYDCWRPHTGNVTVGGVLENLRKNAANAEHLLLRILPALNGGSGDSVLKHVGAGAVKPGSNEHAVITHKAHQDPKQQAALRYLFPTYF